MDSAVQDKQTGGELRKMNYTHKQKIKMQTLSLILTLTVLLGLLPAFDLQVAAASIIQADAAFDSGAVYLDSTYNGKTVQIKQGVFSVTVNGAENVNIIFGDVDITGDVTTTTGVTIDRRYDSDTADGDTVAGLYEISQSLGAAGKAQVCPFLITGNSTVRAGFVGECTFYAGTNAGTVDNDNTYKAGTGGQGFAGIQVDSGSTLTIAYANDLTAYGGHQLGVPDSDGNITGDGGTAKYSDALRANKDIEAAGYDDPFDGNGYYAPENASVNANSGGAGIGGGASLADDPSNTSDYTAGTPGNIIIENGTIEAFGGHQAAGIGGGTNSAATTGVIRINGGTVTAHGGRWAAGIGDGDSVSEKASTLYGGSSLIEINGGTVTAYGGVASPGIGCSDQLSNYTGLGDGKTSGMEIAINGGAVNAYCGFPDGFAGSYQNFSTAPAAIGAGASSNMDPNSIYISSNAILTCAGFGYYSLTEAGNNASQVPTISLDSDGYLFLLRTQEDGVADQYHSSKTRTLKLYAPIRMTHNDVECLVYVDQDKGDLYLVDQDGNIYGNTGEMGELSWEQTISPPDNLTLFINEEGSAYYDSRLPASQLLDSIELAYYFRSIALTLPHPDEYGGLYALSVPTEGITGVTLPENSDHISLTVEATEQGTQSGWVDFPSNSNMGKDNTAAALTDLDLNGDGSTDGLIGDDFLPNVYGYTVYVEPDVTQVQLYAAWEQAKNANGTNADHKIYVDDVLKVSGTAGPYSLKQTVTLAGDKTVVRLKKMDNNSTIGAISYKITIIKKGDYDLALSDPTKVYDGNPVKVTATGVFTQLLPDVYTVVPVLVTSSGSPDPELTLPAAQGTYTSYMRLNNSDDNDRYRNRRVKMDTTVYYLAGPQKNQVYYIVHVAYSNANANGNYDFTFEGAERAAGWLVTYGEDGTVTTERLASPPTGSGFAQNAWIQNETSVTIASYKRGNSTYSVTLTADDAGTIVAKNSSDNTCTLFSLGTATLSEDSTGTKEAKRQEAQQALSDGATSGKYEYEQTVDLVRTQIVQVKTINQGTSGTPASTTQNSQTVAQPKITWQSHETDYFEIQKTPGGALGQIDVPAADLENVEYTFTRTHDAEGTAVTEASTTVPPTQAGTYRVDAQLRTATYNAYGSGNFRIQKRPVTVLRVEHWLHYVDQEPTSPIIAIPDPGAIDLDNLISGDNVTLTVDAANGKVYYDDPDSDTLAVDYRPDKIVLEDAVLTGAQAANYFLDYTDPTLIRVYGQIAYRVDGTIFRKTESGTWRKFYPPTEQDWITDATADYHSPATDGVYLSHAEYVRARTVNNGSGGARYAVDLEFGALQYNFYRSRWDVNDLVYEELAESFWAGNDGVNNRITVVNYSNRSVFCRMEVEMNFYGTGILPTLCRQPDGSQPVFSEEWIETSAALPGSPGGIGTAASTDFYLILGGVPQMGETASYVQVGAVEVRFSPSGSP